MAFGGPFITICYGNLDCLDESTLAKLVAEYPKLRQLGPILPGTRASLDRIRGDIPSL